MSVLVKAKDNRVILFVKGADSSILPKIVPQPAAQEENKKTEKAMVEYNVEAIASKGLRTMVFAMKIVNLSGSSINKLTPADLENNLILLGASGLEDLLQDNVH